MSKATKPGKPAPKTHLKRRVNLRALLILAVVVVLALPGLIGLRIIQQQRAGTAFLREGRARFDEKQFDRAVGYLNNYLELFPDDVEALDLKAQAMAKIARSPDQIEAAVQAHNRVLGAPRKLSDAAMLEARRRLVELSLKVPNRGQANSVLSQAEQLIKSLEAAGKKDAAAYRLRAQAYEELSDYTPDPTEKRAKLESALNDYEQAETIEPGDIDGARQLASLYIDRLEDPQKARVVVDRVVDSSTKDPKKHSEALQLRATVSLVGRDKIRSTDKDAPERRALLLKEAKTDIYKALDADPNNFRARLIAAELELNLHQPELARRHLAAIPADQRDNSEVKVIEGRIDLYDRRPAAAAEAYRVGLSRAGGNDLKLTWELVNLLLTQRLTDPSTLALIEQYKRLAQTNLPIDPERREEEVKDRSARSAYLDGVLLLRSNRPAEAITALESIRYRVPVELRHTYFYNLGEAYLSTRNLAKAADAFHQSAEQSNGWSLPWLAQAKVERQQDREDAAIATLRAGLAINPGDPILIAELADILTGRERRKPKAERSWTEIESLFADASKSGAPPDPELVIAHANFLVAVERLPDALALLQQACSLQPRAVRLWVARANAARQQGLPGEALAIIDKGLVEAGPHADLYIARAASLVQRAEPQLARDTLTDGLAKVPRDEQPQLWKTLGEFDERRGDHARAKAAFEEWAKLEPANPDPKLALVQLAIAAHDESATTKAIEAVREISGPKSYSWRYARILSLIRPPGKTKPSSAQLDEADALAQEIKKNDPQLPLGALLEGQVCEVRGQSERAIAAYQEALKLDGGDAAMYPLVALLIRENRNGDIEALRARLTGTPLATRLEQIEADIVLRSGDKARAELLAERAVKGAPEGLDLRTWQATVLQKSGKPKEAIAALEASIKSTQDAGKPTQPVTWFQLFMVHVAQRDLATAAATIERFKSAKLTPPLEFPDLTYAQLYATIGDTRRASESYQEALRRWGNEPLVITSAVTYFERIRATAEAEAALRSVLARTPSNAWARRRLAELLASRPNDRAAWDEAINLIGTDPRPNDQPEDLVSRARVLAKSPTAAERLKAGAILEKLVASDPNNAPLQELYAQLLVNLRRTADAKAPAAKAAEGDNASIDAVLFYAGVLLDLKELDAADAQLDRVAKADPDNLGLMDLRARSQMLRGKPLEGATALLKAFEARVTTPVDLALGEALLARVRQMDPRDESGAAEAMGRRLATLGPRGQCLLAWVLSSKGKADEAQSLLEKAGSAGEPHAPTMALSLAIEPNADPRWLTLADRLVTEALKASPSSPDLLEKQALVRHLQKNFKEEIATYKAILALNPPTRLFLNNMAWTLSEEMNQPKEALKWADEALKAVGPSSAVLDTRGVILTRLGQYDQAVRDLQAAVDDSPTGSYCFHLARAFHKMGRVEESRKYRDLAREAKLSKDQLQPSELEDWDAVMKP